MTGISARPARASRGAAAKSTEQHRFVRSLTGTIDLVRVGPLYYLGLLGAAAVMVVLPLVYLGLVGFVGYALYWHLVYDFPAIEHTREGRRVTALKFFPYLFVALVGALLLLFMIKPLFARRGEARGRGAVDRDAEPLLFAFVERLCAVVGAPVPSRIEVDTRVNASAGFNGGLAGFIRKDLVLVIGLPLVAGLSMRQLAGVLAHEFGHFAQGTAMRLSFVVRSINLWFARVVYERDAFDEWLRRASGDGENGIVLLLTLPARLFIFVTRGVLWVLMMAGHAVSSFLTRQMEYDADRYCTRVVGSGEFADMHERIRRLDAAYHAAFSDLQAAWQEKRLGDDLALLVCHRDHAMPDDVLRALRKSAAEEKAGVFDTHPSDAARVRHSEREACPGLFQLDDPATDLFTDFCTLSRDITLEFYANELGLDLSSQNLTSSSSLITHVEKSEEAQKSAGRWFQGLIHPVRPVFLPAMKPDVSDRDAAAELLLERRGQIAGAGERFARVRKAYKDADKRLASVRVARSLLSAGLKVDFAKLDLPRGDYSSFRAVEQQAAANRQTAVERLNAVLSPQVERLHVALELAAPPPVVELTTADLAPAGDAAGADIDLAPDDGEYDLKDDPTDAAPGGGDALQSALAAMGRAAHLMEDLRQNWLVLGALLHRLRGEGKDTEQVLIETLARSRKLAHSLNDVRGALHKVAYPYEHVDRNVTLALFVIKAIPAPEDVGIVFRAGELAMDAYYQLYLRVLSDLCSRAEAFERSLGLEPLPEPPKSAADGEDDEGDKSKAKKQSEPALAPAPADPATPPREKRLPGKPARSALRRRGDRM